MKVYLGDGVYAEMAQGRLKLTTENGISVQNTVWLEPEVWAALVEFVKEDQ